MNLEEADHIVQSWGRYLEYEHGLLSLIFFTGIPKSFLPFPGENIETAIDLVVKHYDAIGNQQAVQVLQTAAPLLALYIDDEEALLRAAKTFNDSKWREAVLPAMKKFQFDRSR